MRRNDIRRLIGRIRTASNTTSFISHSHISCTTTTMASNNDNSILKLGLMAMWSTTSPCTHLLVNSNDTVDTSLKRLLHFGEDYENVTIPMAILLTGGDPKTRRLLMTESWASQSVENGASISIAFRIPGARCSGPSLSLFAKLREVDEHDLTTDR